HPGAAAQFRLRHRARGFPSGGLLPGPHGLPRRRQVRRRAGLPRLVESPAGRLPHGGPVAAQRGRGSGRPRGRRPAYGRSPGGGALPDFYREPIEAAFRKARPKGIEHNERVAIAQDSVAWVYDTTADGSSVAHTATRLTQVSGVWTVEGGSRGVRQKALELP